MVLPSAPPAALAGPGSADEKLVHLDASGQFFPLIADGAASKFLKPSPSGAVTAEAQQLFEIHGIDAGFTGREPPHGLEPIGDGLFGTVHDRSCGQ